MPQRRFIMWGVLLVIAVSAAAVIVWIRPALFPAPTAVPPVRHPSVPVLSTSTGYAPEVPADAVLTTPKAEAPASANPTSDAKARFFDLRATAEGFSPATITVNRGDTLYVDFTSVDGAYDISIPYLGAAFSPVAQGTTKRLPFDVTMSGTFTFECFRACPAVGKIQGTLIVLP